MSFLEAFTSLDARVRNWALRYSPTAIRWTLGIVFIWFGALKILGVSPVEDLVISTVPWLPNKPFVVGLGIWEVIVGLGLLSGFAIRIVLAMFLLQMLGTFVSAIVQPHLMFVGSNPLMLSLEGEFLLKNLVLIAAGAATAASAPAASPRTGLLRILFARAHSTAPPRNGSERRL